MPRAVTRRSTPMEQQTRNSKFKTVSPEQWRRKRPPRQKGQNGHTTRCGDKRPRKNKALAANVLCYLVYRYTPHTERKV